MSTTTMLIKDKITKARLIARKKNTQKIERHHLTFGIRIRAICKNIVSGQRI